MQHAPLMCSIVNHVDHGCITEEAGPPRRFDPLVSRLPGASAPLPASTLSCIHLARPLPMPQPIAARRRRTLEDATTGSPVCAGFDRVHPSLPADRLRPPVRAGASGAHARRVCVAVEPVRHFNRPAGVGPRRPTAGLPCRRPVSSRSVALRVGRSRVGTAGGPRSLGALVLAGFVAQAGTGVGPNFGW